MENKLINELYRINKLMGVDNIIVENVGPPINALRKLFSSLTDNVIDKIVVKTGVSATDNEIANTIAKLKSGEKITQKSLNTLMSQLDGVKLAKLFSKNKKLMGEGFYTDIEKFKKLLESNPNKYNDVIAQINNTIDNVPYLRDLPDNLKNSLKLELKVSMDTAKDIGVQAKKDAAKAAKAANNPINPQNQAPPSIPAENTNLPNIQKTWNEVTSSITDDTIKKIEKKFGSSWGPMLSRLKNAITVPFKNSKRLQNEIIQDFGTWGKSSPNSRPIIKNNIIAKLTALENSQKTILDATNAWIEKELGPKAAINPVTKLPIDSDFHGLYTQIKDKKGWGRIKYLDKIYNSIGIAIKDIIDNNKLINVAFFKTAMKPFTIPANLVTKMFTGNFGNLGKLTDEQVKVLKNWFITTNPAGIKGLKAAFKNNGKLGGLTYVSFQALYRYFWISTVYGIIRTLGAASAQGFDLTFDTNISDKKITNYLFGTEDWKEINKKFVENPDASNFEYAMAIYEMIGKQSEPFKKWLGLWPLGKVLATIVDIIKSIQNNKLSEKVNEIKQEVEKAEKEVKQITNVNMDNIQDRAESLKGKVTRNKTNQPQNTNQQTPTVVPKGKEGWD